MRRLTGAGSDALLPLVSGSPRPATVVGAGPYATYLRLDARPDEPGGEVLALVTRHAVRLPCAVVLPEGVEPPPELLAGTTVEVGLGAIRWTGGELTVARWWPAAAVTGATGLPPAAPVERDMGLPSRLAALVADVGDHTLPESVPAALGQAITGIRRADAEAVVASVVPVLGSGPGLTPSADDAVAGVLLTARSWYGTDVGPLLSRMGALLAPHLDRRTTAVSAGLLQHASEGRGAPEVVRAVEYLTGRHRDDEHDVLRRLVELGHTSGRDTALGVLAFLDAQTPTVTSGEATATGRSAPVGRHDRSAVPQHDPPARENA